jgi:ATP-dependent RNA helicase DeaD
MTETKTTKKKSSSKIKDTAAIDDSATAQKSAPVPEPDAVPAAAAEAPAVEIPVEELKETPVAETPVSETEEVVPPGKLFRDLNLSEPVLRAVIEAGFEAPTPIQEQSIPVLLSGKDLIGQAQTGTGKTAAFALPISDLLDSSFHYPQAIVLLPTRELCIQVAQETHNLSKYRKLRVVPVYGGQPIDRQFRALSQGAQVVVGTPGRVLDHLRRGTLDLSKVRIVVLDEADEMLNMGFLEDVEEILKDAPEARQTALFSATMPPRIAALAKTYLRDPERVTIESKRRTVALVEQKYYEVAPSQKVEALSRILDMESPGATIIFCRTRRDVDELGESLQLRGYEAETLHGEMNQAARDRVMSKFRAGAADLLIATDVAARGLDIDQVTHVINYDIPWDVESYIHRIGRTGRAGRSGEAITLVSPRERYQLRLIERTINAPIRPCRVPTSADIASRRREMFKDKLKGVINEGNSDGFLSTVEEIMEEGSFDASQIAAAALQMLWQKEKGAADYDIAQAQVETERTETGMTRLFLQIGRQDGIRPGDIVGAIANEAGVAGNAIGTIDIMDRSTFVEVPEADAQLVIEALNRTKMRGRKVYAEVARPRREDDPGAPAPGGFGGGGREWQPNPRHSGPPQGGPGRPYGGPPRGGASSDRDRPQTRFGGDRQRFDRNGKKPFKPDHDGPKKHFKK